jgi:hypothetical protein
MLELTAVLGYTATASPMGVRMAEPASFTAPNGPSARDTLTALDRHIKELRRDLSETLDLIERLRESCVSLHGKIDAAEREHERLASQLLGR